MAEITVDGKTVVLHDKLPARTLYAIIPHISAVRQGDNIFEKIPWEAAKSLVMGVIESWEFKDDEGNPINFKNPMLYEDMTPLQLTDFFMPLVIGCYAHVVDMINAQADASGE